jgi:hypothetical protein
MNQIRVTMGIPDSVFSGRVIRDPKAMFVRSVAQKHVHAAEPGAKGGSPLPIVKQ